MDVRNRRLPGDVLGPDRTVETPFVVTDEILLEELPSAVEGRTDRNAVDGDADSRQ